MKFEPPSSAALDARMRKARDIDKYLAGNQEYMLNQSLKEHLNALLIQKGLLVADVARGSELDRGYVYQIFNGNKHHFRDKLIAIAFGLGLDEDETQRMLKLSRNKELYVRDKRDAVILFALQRKKTLSETNELLYDHGMTVLGITE